MNPKFKTLEWWSICIWFFIFGAWSAIVIWGRHLIPINQTIIIAGLFMMIMCSMREEEWFPSETKPLRNKELSASECANCGTWVERISNNDYCPRCASRLAQLPIFPEGDEET